MAIVGQIALVTGVLSSLIVQYLFYIRRDRSPKTFSLLAAANLLLLVAARAIPVILPTAVTVLLWCGFFFGLAIAVFYEYLPLAQTE